MVSGVAFGHVEEARPGTASDQRACDARAAAAWGGRPDDALEHGGRVRASQTPDGPVTARFADVPDGVEVEAWGPGAEWLIEHAPAWCGALDDDSEFDPPPGPVRRALASQAGLRIPRTELVTERLIPVVFEQKVTGWEARRAYVRLVRALGEPAPGPLGLTLPPDPAASPGLRTTTCTVRRRAPPCRGRPLDLRPHR